MEFKDNKNKKGNFLKREGFYVILFVCLCIVATVAAVTSRNKTAKDGIDSAVTNEVNTAIDSYEKDTVLKTDNDKTMIDNALEVKNDGEELVQEDVVEATEDTNTAEAEVTEEVATQETETVAVTSTNVQSFINPVEGTIVRQYSEVPVFWQTTDTSRPNFGIDIASNLDDLGAEVVAVLDGEVKEISDMSLDGVKVVLYHPQNGLRTVYANLNQELDLDVGDQVKQGDVIGKIGGTTIRAAYEEYGNNFLHFEVMSGSDEDVQYSSLDPMEYVNY